MAEAAPREAFLTVAGCRTLVQRGGEGPPLLFLHGGGGGGAWQPWMARLARRFEVIAPELPGFGRSDTPDWLETIHDAAYCVLDLMDALDLRGAQVVGHSLGGWVAVEAAVRSVERVAGLTLVAPAGLNVPGVPKPDLFLMTPEELARARFHDPRLAEAAMAEPADEAALDRALKNRFAMARLMWAPRGFDPHLHKWLHRVRVPVLVAWGAQDALLPAGPYAARWAELLPRATVRMFDACGHLPQLEQAEDFCAAVEALAEGATGR